MDSAQFITELLHTDQLFILFYFKEVEALFSNPVCPLMITVWADNTQLILQSTQVWQLLWQGLQSFLYKLPHLSS